MRNDGIWDREGREGMGKERKGGGVGFVWPWGYTYIVVWPTLQKGKYSHSFSVNLVVPCQ